MTTEEIITVYETLKADCTKAYELYQELCSKPQKDIDHPDTVALRNAKYELDKLKNAFDAFRNNDW